jgi:simple sugar transport system substrate-binding protein/basic membrane protein A
LAEIVRRILQKEQKGEVVHLGIRDNAVGFAIKKGFLSKEAEAKLNGLILAIQKGEIDVFKEQP